MALEIPTVYQTVRCKSNGSWRLYAHSSFAWHGVLDGWCLGKGTAAEAGRRHEDDTNK
jgi:hypothetical protein